MVGAGLLPRLGLQPRWSQLAERSLLLFGSVALARVLGFGFTIVTARALGPAGFGLVTFTLTLANIASLALFNSPAGLAPALVRSESRTDRQKVLESYLAVIGALLLISLLVALPFGWLAGLRGGVLVGLLLNLAGITTLTVYREILRGIDRFDAVAAYNVACNLVQLVAVALFWRFGLTEPALYIAAFGLSSVAAIAAIAPWSPVGFLPSLRDVDRERLKAVVGFVAPMLMQTVFFMLWLNADVVVLNALTNLSVVGHYGAAKSLANATLLVPSAIATALLPQAARTAPNDARRYFVGLLVPACLASLLPLAGFIVLGPWIFGHLFGPGYAPATGALLVLACGMTMYGIGLTLDASWTAMGRPRLVMTAAAVSAFATGLLIVPLVIRFGMFGAALAVTAGAASRLALLIWVSLAGVPAGSRPSTASQEKVSDFFDGLAGFWSEVYAARGVFAEIHRRRLELAMSWIDSLALLAGARILVVGAGAGFEVVALARRGYRVTAVEPATRMIEIARQRAQAAGCGDVHWVKGDAQMLGLAPDSFEVVVALGVIPWLPSPAAAMAEMGRVLRPGGWWLGTTDNALRLDHLVDPAQNPLSAPVVAQIRKRVRGRNRDATPSPRAHSRGATRRLLAGAGLHSVADVTFGFGPFTLLNRPVLPEALALSVNARMTRLALRGFPFARVAGDQRLVLGRKGLPAA